jgi:hypothetical protein
VEQVVDVIADAVLRIVLFQVEAGRLTKNSILLCVHKWTVVCDLRSPASLL